MVNVDLRSSLLTLGIADASIALLSLNRSLQWSMFNGQCSMFNGQCLIAKRSGGWWEIFDPIDGIYHMYGSRQKAIAAKKQFEQKSNPKPI